MPTPPANPIRPSTMRSLTASAIPRYAGELLAAGPSREESRDAETLLTAIRSTVAEVDIF